MDVDIICPNCSYVVPLPIRDAYGFALVEAMQHEQDRADAASDAAEFNDPREQDRLQDEADERYEYSKEEYHDE